MDFPLGFVGREEERPLFPGDVVLCILLVAKPLTALAINSRFQNPVNPPILLFDWLIR
jgi:hypothetical protein